MPFFRLSHFRVLTLFFVSYSALANAADTGKNHHLYLGIGAFFQNMGKVTSSNDASASLTGSMYVPQLMLGTRFGLFGQTLMPTLSYNPIAKKESDEITKNMLTFSLPLIFRRGQTFELKAGVGAMLYSVGGKGGSTVLSNGTSTATFYRPDGSKTARNLFIDLGTSIALFYGFRMDLDFMIPNPLSARRSVNLLLALNKGVF